MNELAPIRPAMKGQVTAIVPQSIEEVFRVSKGVVQSGLAPDALVKGKDADAAAMAVAVAIMSGAELGLKPMVALRSFTVINGKPALYGDGLINVIRQSGKAAYLRTGCEQRDGKLVGWCEAKRSDTEEQRRVEFSQDDAVRAGLWQPSGNTPWAKYPQRMLAWRAAGWCLRELFGDVLGGMRDEFEADEMVEPERSAIAPPPPAPADDFVDVVVEPKSFDAEGFLANLFVALGEVEDEDRLEEVWDEWDVESTLSGNQDAMQRAFDMKKDRLEAISFPGDRP
jgi:hypothetical protein